ncbi:hypothetical protein QBC35DRAFT_26242 [Podospora australis]|uniref:Uncharacterized protein n=1 Tax=Podospora australis TaxID=1536484 RepID=A0AAN6X389_9PEZI|nr:hypothetical protein QBC35DRAFT_26242 [Podospora australis]
MACDASEENSQRAFWPFLFFFGLPCFSSPPGIVIRDKYPINTLFGSFLLLFNGLILKAPGRPVAWGKFCAMERKVITTSSFQSTGYLVQAAERWIKPCWTHLPRGVQTTPRGGGRPSDSDKGVRVLGVPIIYLATSPIDNFNCNSRG